MLTLIWIICLKPGNFSQRSPAKDPRIPLITQLKIGFTLDSFVEVLISPSVSGLHILNSSSKKGFASLSKELSIAVCTNSFFFLPPKPITGSGN